MKASNWLDSARAQLNPTSSSPRLDAEIILCHVLNVDRAQLLGDLNRSLNKNELTQLAAALRCRVDNVPLAYITGSIEFYGVQLEIDSNVLCPRPETEQLVERAVKSIDLNSIVVDIGTGSGAIACALATVRPDLAMHAIDNSHAALEIAGNNFKKHNLDIDCYESDLLNNVDTTNAVVANLPYLPSTESLDESVEHEPKSALLSGPDGLEHHRKLFEQLKKRPETRTVLIEADPNQISELNIIAEGTDYKLTWNQNYSFEFKRV